MPMALQMVSEQFDSAGTLRSAMSEQDRWKAIREFGLKTEAGIAALLEQLKKQKKERDLYREEQARVRSKMEENRAQISEQFVPARKSGEALEKEIKELFHSLKIQLELEEAQEEHSDEVSSDVVSDDDEAVEADYTEEASNDAGVTSPFSFINNRTPSIDFVIGDMCGGYDSDEVVALLILKTELKHEFWHEKCDQGIAHKLFDQMCSRRGSITMSYRRPKVLPQMGSCRWSEGRRSCRFTRLPRFSRQPWKPPWKGASAKDGNGSDALFSSLSFPTNQAAIFHCPCPPDFIAASLGSNHNIQDHHLRILQKELLWMPLVVLLNCWKGPTCLVSS